MSPNLMRKKVMEYVNHAEDDVLEVVYKMLQIYVDEGGKSAMNKSQKRVVEERSEQYKRGKLNTSTWSEVKKSAKA